LTLAAHPPFVKDTLTSIDIQARQLRACPGRVDGLIAMWGSPWKRLVVVLELISPANHPQRWGDFMSEWSVEEARC